MTFVEPLSGVHAVPLVVDVDGTLLRTDLLHETALHFIAARPVNLLKLAGWVTHGKAALKERLATATDLDASLLPLREETVSLISRAQAEGRPVYLASASDRTLVKKIAERIGGIASIFASDGSRNLAGPRKADALVQAFGTRGFDYVGDRPVDFPVWSQARTALAVCHSAAFERSVLLRHPDGQIVARAETPPRQYLRAMRPHQWAKNVLLFLALMSGHHFDLPSVFATLLAFACFCMAASSAYLLNDLLDLPNDRTHPRKRKRPFASGAVPIAHGVLLGAALFLGAAGLSLLLPPSFVALLALYVVATISYSLFLKRKLFVDIITLGGLYTIRVMAGLEASHAAKSEWLLMICLFLFMSLATVKRCSELVVRRNAGGTTTVGRGYRVEDLPVLGALGAAAGYATSLILALYITSPEVVRLYEHPERLWLVEPLFLYWISRILIMANRGDLHDDPVIFACTDRISLLTAGVTALVVAAAL